jgi:NADH-quinone oxidoreductase subunit J
MLADLNAVLLPAYFWAFSLVAVACALGVLIARHPLHGAVNLIGVMLALAGLYALLGSPYLAVLQVLVYAGAIMMLVVFVIMVLNQARDDTTPRFDRLALPGLVLPLGVAVVALMALRATAGALRDAGPPDAGISRIAAPLFSTAPAGPGYYLLFLAIGVLLLVAIVAAILLAKRSLDTPTAPAAPAEDGHAH